MAMPKHPPVILWFREDLRLSDNPALSAACESGQPVLPLFILDDETSGGWKLGGASRWWLHHSLSALGQALEAKGAPLMLRRSRADQVLDELVEKTGATAVFWNRRYDPAGIEQDRKIKQSLRDRSLDARSFNGGLLAEPWTLKTQSGDPYKVFTPFWKALRDRLDGLETSPPPSQIAGFKLAGGERLDDWALLPRSPDWAGGLRSTWTPGEAAARARLASFIGQGMTDYADDRNRPDRNGTSMLSPHLRWGEIGPRQVWHAVRHALDAGGTKALAKGGESFLREITWREFSTNLLFHWPEFPERNWRRSFDAFPWKRDADALRAWQRGRTGYPIVDAGMRQLWQIGWMHNRVRMIAASFLIKDLMLDWREGERWFWDTLVDADLANNSAGWQWVAGSGADAAPFFRVFNPVTQGHKFDPEGNYVRRWVPELAKLPSEHIQAPWEAPPEILKKAGVELGHDYPRPIIDHAKARQRALAAFERIKQAA